VRLLIVGFAYSIHIARYLQLLPVSEWDVHLFASEGHATYPELPGEVTLHLPDPKPYAERVEELANVIAALRPDVVHSHEIQHAGALVAHARRHSGPPQPPWFVTSWGSDIFWNGRDPFFRRTIRDVLTNCDYYGTDCHRDVGLARAFGLQGRVIGVWPVPGGIDPAHAASLRTPGPTSARRAIAVKGRVSNIGQGLVAFAAVERCADLLTGWEVGGYLVSPDLGRRYEALAARSGFSYTEVSQIPQSGPLTGEHDQVLALQGRARVSLALNRSDGNSLSFLEAITMGAFPVQSSSCCGAEYVPQGRGALYVPATDAAAVAMALRRALTDDALVDAGAELNARIVAEHFDRDRIREQVVNVYEGIVADSARAAA
jgi:glycosyltransferase involved in cell wall biosynthesis